MSSSTRLHDLRALMQQWSGAVRAPLGAFPRDSAERATWLFQGLEAGEISEWVAAQEGSGVVKLAFSVVRRRIPGDSRWLIIDPQKEISASALVQMGFDLSRVVFVQGRETADAFWATEQGLRSRGVDVVCVRFSKLAPLAFRRLKLAAEAGHSRCLLLRGPQALRETSWADMRLLVSPLPSPSWGQRRLCVEVRKIRNGLPGRQVHVELDDETGAVRLVSELADSADYGCAAGA